MKNKIYSFWGNTALKKAQKFLECAEDTQGNQARQ